MRDIPFSKNTLSPRAAKFWIYGAVGVSIYTGLATILAVKKQLLGATWWNLIDAAVCFAIAYGIARRSLLVAWLGLAYYVSNRVLLYIGTGHLPTSMAMVFLVFYSLAIMCIRLYPVGSAAKNAPPVNPSDETEARTKDGAV